MRCTGQVPVFENRTLTDRLVDLLLFLLLLILSECLDRAQEVSLVFHPTFVFRSFALSENSADVSEKEKMTGWQAIQIKSRGQHTATLFIILDALQKGVNMLKVSLCLKKRSMKRILRGNASDYDFSRTFNNPRQLLCVSK